MARAAAGGVRGRRVGRAGGGPADRAAAWRPGRSSIDLELAAGRHSRGARRARGAHRRPSAARAAARPPDARALPRRPAGRRARRLPARPRRCSTPNWAWRPSAELREPAGGDPAADPDLAAPERRRRRSTPQTPAPSPSCRAPAAAPADVVPRPRRRPAAGRRAAARPRGWSPSPVPAASGRPASPWRPRAPPRDGFPDGVAFVRLAGVTDPARFRRPCWPRWRSGTCADGDRRGPAARPPARPRPPPGLDNCEHLARRLRAARRALLGVLPGAAAAGHQPRAAGRPRRGPDAPSTRCPVPTPDADVAELAGSAAVQLFVDRARGVLPDFALGEANARRGRRHLPAPRRHAAGHRAGRRPGRGPAASTSSPGGWATASPC